MDNSRKSFLDWVWDVLCAVSLVGIWPRFIEPRLLFTVQRDVFIPDLPPGLEGLKVVHFSDLHVNNLLLSSFLHKIAKKISALSPDLVLFSGDLLSYSILTREEELSSFFRKIASPLGTFACLGNHDYGTYVSLNESGVPIEGPPPNHAVLQGFARLFGHTSPDKRKALSPQKFHEGLLEFYQKNDVTLLHNETVQVGRRGHLINLTGLGDLIAGHLHPSDAFKNWNFRYPGIVFAHTPDCYPYLKNYPGNLFLFGHTHGGAIFLPFFWDKITPLINKIFRSGLFERDNRTLFVNRGTGSTFPFRLFAPPQIALFTLKKGGLQKAPLFFPQVLKETSPDISLATSRTVEDQ